MKLINKYNTFVNEFNRKDKFFIEQLSDHFTISIEYEIVADYDIDEEPITQTEYELDQSKKFAKEQTYLDLSRGKFGYRFDDRFKLPLNKLKDNELNMTRFEDISKISDKQIKNIHKKYITLTYVDQLMNDQLELIDIHMDEDDYTKSINRFQRKFKDDISNYIINTLDKNIIKFIFEQNMQHLKDMMLKYLPNFTKKWGNTFKFELEADSDKQRILEFSPKTYVNGINECFEQINDFYDDFNNQDFWKMNDRTAIHVNVGSKNKVEWNPLKGLLIMNDMNRDDKTPFVFTNIMNRINNRFTQSLLDAIKRNLTGEISKDYDTDDVVLSWNLSFRHKDRLEKHKDFIKQNINKLNLHNIEQCEDFFNSFLIKANSDFYIKEFGIKITELDTPPGYVEFRYIGGNLDKEKLMDKILYFCYIIYTMTNKEYKKKEYHKKLFKYIEEIKNILND